LSKTSPGTKPGTGKRTTKESSTTIIAITNSANGTANSSTSNNLGSISAISRIR
jgi:hypothetical protein